MATRVVEGKKPYTGGEAIDIDQNKVISLKLRDENNLIIYDSGDDEIYVDLQLPDGITPTDAFPVGVTTGRAVVADGWDKAGTIICAKTTSGDNIKLLYADDGTLWIDNGTGTFKEIPLGGSGGGADIEYVTQVEYDALPSSKLTDGKHYVIYTSDSPTPPSPGWQPGVNTVAYWKLDGDLTDYMGNYNGTATGGATITYESLPGDSSVKCVKVNSGSFNDGITLSSSIWDEVGQQQTSFTFGGFVKRTGLYAYLLYLGGTSSIAINFACDNQSHLPGGGGLLLDLPGQSEEQLTGSFADGLWHSILWAYNHNTRIKSFYVDGQLAGTLTASNDYTTNSSGIAAYLARINNNLCMSNMVFETNTAWTQQEAKLFHDTFKSLYGIS